MKLATGLAVIGILIEFVVRLAWLLDSLGVFHSYTYMYRLNAPLQVVSTALLFVFFIALYQRQTRKAN
jgi:hypothetical protein